MCGSSTVTCWHLSVRAGAPRAILTASNLQAYLMFFEC
jgi:hypothetical protein